MGTAGEKGLAQVYAAAFVFALCFNALAPIIPEVAQDFRLSGMDGLVWIGGLNNLLLFGPMGVVSLFYAVVGKRLAASFSTLGVFLVGVFVLLYYSPGAAVFAAGYFLLGSCLGIAIPGLYGAARRLPASADHFKTSININIMIGIGMAVGQYGSALIGGVSEHSWRFVYAALAGAVLCLVPILISLDRAGKQDDSKRISVKAVPRPAALLLSQYLPGSVPWGGLTVFIFPYLEIDCSLAKSSAVFLVTVLGIGMIAGSFAAGAAGDRMADRWGSRAVIAAIVVFFLLDILAASVVIELSAKLTLPVLTLLYFAAGMLLAVPGSYIKGLLFKTASKESVHAIFSLENFLESLGKGLGPFVVALLIQYLAGIKTALLAASLFWLLCLPPVFMLLKNSKEPCES